MKNKLQEIIAVLLIVLVLATSVFGQTWTPQVSGTSNDLSSVYFLNDLTGWVVGANGTILLTTDGGTNWNAATSKPNSNPLYEVQFVDANNGFIAAGNEVWVSTNGGVNWSVTSATPATGIFGIHFLSASTGYAVGTDSHIYYTTDGGSSWSVNSTIVSSGATLSDVSFYDANYGITVGSNGRVFYTTDGGTTWSASTTSITVAYIQKVRMISATVGFFAVNYQVYKTTDGGNNWTSSYPNLDNTLNSVYFVDANNGIAVATGGKIGKTTNAGNSWSDLTSGTTQALYDVFFPSNNIGYVVGGTGTILKTTDGALPVELTSFTANLVDGKVELNWQTATEVNNYGFDVETLRATSDEWQTIGFVQGSGNSNSPKNYTFIDENPLQDSVEYRLKQIDTDGNYSYYSETVKVAGFGTTDVDDDTLPTEYKLSQNYPNPFNPSTVISFALPKNGLVTLKVYNAIGEEVAELVNREMNAGIQSINFDATNFSSGIYFYRISAGNFIETKKMVLMK